MPSTKKRLTPQDLLTFPLLTDAQISPDGSTVAYTSGDLLIDKAKNPPRHIRLVDVDSGKDRQFSNGLRADQHPRWSPDGKHIAFISDRAQDGEWQLYVMSRDGGEALQLTDIRGEIDI